MFLSELGEDVAAPRSWWVAHDDGKLLGLAAVWSWTVMCRFWMSP